MERLFQFGSVSNASRAKRILLENGIRTKLVKTDTKKDGCAWGISLPEEKMLDAARILRGRGVRYESI